MGKWVGIAFIVLGIWIGMTIFTEGTDVAFDGLFASQAAREAPSEVPSEAPSDARSAATLDRVRSKLDAARELQEQRLERQLD